MRRWRGREIGFLVFAGVATMVIITAFIAMGTAAARLAGRGGDFLLPWRAARGFLFEDTEPYGAEIARQVQQDVYGREARAAVGEKPYILDEPFPVELFFLPLGFIHEAAMARGVYLLVSESALLALTFLSLRLTDWQPRRLFTILFFLVSALNFYSLTSLLEGSPVFVLGVLYAGVLLALRSGSDELAGALMALSMHRLEIGGLFLLFVLLRVLRQQRWRVLSGVFMTLFVLLALSFFADPGWVLSYLRATLANLHWSYGLSPGVILTGLWPEWGPRLGWGLTGLLLVVLASEWAAGATGDFRRFYWAACLTLAVTPLAGVRSELQSLAVLIIPLALIFAVVRERWRAGYWLGGSLLLLLFAAPWAVSLGTFVPPGLRQQVIFLLLPGFTVAGLYWTRWWAIRPPRTWLERVSVPEYR